MMPGAGPPSEYPEGGTWPTTGQVTVGGATHTLSPAIAGVAMGGRASLQVLRRELATMLECCRSAEAASAQVRFGSATWDSSPKTDGDHLSRYYPLWVNDREIYDASVPVVRADLLARIRSTGRDIAHHVDAAGIAGIQDSENGKMCEIPEQFRLGRYYDVPLTQESVPQPDIYRTDPQPIVPTLQWEWSRGFTVSMLYRYRSVRQEQSLFSLSPVLRFGVSWLGELTVEITLENGDKLSAWSTQRLSSEDWSHVAMTYDPWRSKLRVYLNGVNVIELAFTRAMGPVDACYIGRWDGGSLMNGDAQDVRIYDSVLRSEFIAAEVNSYCADWVEVVA